MNTFAFVFFTAVLTSTAGFGLQTAGKQVVAAGGATLIGAATDADGALLVDVVVHVELPSLGKYAECLTAQDGECTLSLPAGEAVVSFDKIGYSPGDPGSMVSRAPARLLLTSQSVSRIAVRMSKRAVIAGIIRSLAGAPLAGLRVTALNLSALAEGPVALPDLPSTETDDEGQYRFFDLAPGRWVVWAEDKLSVVATGLRPLQPSIAEVDRVLSGLRAGDQGVRPISIENEASAPIYFPGTPYVDRASHIVLSLAANRNDCDLVFRRPAVRSVSGTVIGPSDFVRSSRISLSSLTGIPRAAGLGPEIIQPDAKGHFQIHNLQPGNYQLLARAGAQPRPDLGSGALPMSPTDLDRPVLLAVATVAVEDADVEGLSLSLVPAAQVRGRVTVPENFDKLRFAQLQVVFVPRPLSELGTAGAAMRRTGDIAIDGSFAIAGIVPGSYDIAIRGLEVADAWWLKSAMSEGVDLLDAGLTVRPGSRSDDLVLALTRSESVLRGRVLSDSEALTGLYVVVFPSSPTLWTSGRRIRIAQTASNGEYFFSNLPTGDYVVAVVRDKPFEWRSAPVLNELAPAGAPVRLAGSGIFTQNLKIAR